MSVTDKVSYFSRFTMKFVEIFAASVATAVGGYLVAHLGGYLSWPARGPTPAAVQAAPSASSVVSKTSRARPAQPAPPAAPVSADAGEQRPVPAQDVSSAAKRPARTTVTAKEAAPPHKTTGTNAAESKPRESESPESKRREAESVEAQVRAALEKVDANRPAPPDVAARTADIPPPGPPGPPAVAAEPRPAEAPVAGTTGAVAPRAAEVVPQPVQQAPVLPEPLTPVEIKSRPVAAVDPSPSPEPTTQAHAEDKGLLSTLEKIPEMLRPASGATSDPPRPPLPVGQ